MVVTPLQSREAYTCVGVDVSKGKSAVSAFRWGNDCVMSAHDVPHTASALSELAASLKRLDGSVRVVMEHTGRHWLPVAQTLHEAGVFVCAVNPKLIKDFGDNKLRKLKTDKADSKKIARYGLSYWNDLVPYVPTDSSRQKLLEFSRQLDNSNKLLTAQKNNLQAIVNSTFPGVRKLFTSPARDDGHIKWVDFVCEFYHCDYVRKLGEKRFSERYRVWCKRHGYNFTTASCAKIFAAALDQVPSLPFDSDVKLIVNEIAKQLTAVSVATEVYRRKCGEIASVLPEYDCVTSMFGCGRTTAPQIMAEVGDPTRFKDRAVDGKTVKAKNQLAQFAGVTPGKNQSGDYDQGSVKASKKGSAPLRKTLFQILSTYVKRKPADDPIYLFIDRKRSEGKPYFVYMTAAANKFLQRYYCKVRDFLAAKDVSEPQEAPLAA